MYARTNMRIKGRWICNLYNKFIIKHFYRMKRFTVLLIWIKKKLMDRKNWFWKYYVNDSFGIETYIII